MAMQWLIVSPFYIIQVFDGHPRTPWTAKYHPTDSDIIASGCLGCEVSIRVAVC